MNSTGQIIINYYTGRLHAGYEVIVHTYFTLKYKVEFNWLARVLMTFMLKVPIMSIFFIFISYSVYHPMNFYENNLIWIKCIFFYKF